MGIRAPAAPVVDMEEVREDGMGDLPKLEEEAEELPQEPEILRVSQFGCDICRALGHLSRNSCYWRSMPQPCSNELTPGPCQSWEKRDEE